MPDRIHPPSYEPEPDPEQTPVPWRYLLNPCDIDRFPWLAPIGDFFAFFGSDCRCCSGARVLFAAAAAGLTGFLIGAYT